MFCFLIKDQLSKEEIKNLLFIFTTIIQFTTMSTTRSEYNYNLAVEAAVRKVMSEMAIKNDNDSVVSTEEIDESASLSTVSDHKIFSDVIVSNNDAEKKKKKKKKDRSRSSASESKKMCKSKKSSSKDKKKNNKTESKKIEKMISLIKNTLAELHDLDQEHPSGDIASKDAEEKKKSRSRSKSKSKKIRKSKKSSSTKDKKKNTKAIKENEKNSSLIERLLVELHNLKQEDTSEDTRDYNTGLSIGHKDQHKIPSHIFVKSRSLSNETLGYGSDDDSISSSAISVTSNVSAITSPWMATAIVGTK